MADERILGLTPIGSGFSDEKKALWRWKRAVIERFAMLRLTVHPEAQLAPVCEVSRG